MVDSWEKLKGRKGRRSDVILLQQKKGRILPKNLGDLIKYSFLGQRLTQ